MAGFISVAILRIALELSKLKGGPLTELQGAEVDVRGSLKKPVNPRGPSAPGFSDDLEVLDEEIKELRTQLAMEIRLQNDQLKNAARFDG